MALSVDLNVDMGESFGRWRLGDDEALMPFIRPPASRAGSTQAIRAMMRRTVHAAIEQGVRWARTSRSPTCSASGAGGWRSRRRTCAITRCTRSAPSRRSWRPRAGRLRTSSHTARYTRSLCRRRARRRGRAGNRRGRRRLLLLLLTEDVAPAVREHGVRFVPEALVDLDYSPDGNLVIEPVKRAWEPERVAARAVRLAQRRHRRDRRQRAQRAGADGCACTATRRTRRTPRAPSGNASTRPGFR